MIARSLVASFHRLCISIDRQCLISSACCAEARSLKATSSAEHRELEEAKFDIESALSFCE